jgi:hypothetical protein
LQESAAVDVVFQMIMLDKFLHGHSPSECADVWWTSRRLGIFRGE